LHGDSLNHYLNINFNALFLRIKDNASNGVFLDSKLQKVKNGFSDLEACQLTVDHETSLERV